jgi:aminopeptidase N
VAHEIAHQYWGFDTVLDKGDYFYWPGLPLGIYTDQLYMARRGTRRFSIAQYRAAIAKGLDTTIRRTRAQMKANRFDWGTVISHEKAYAVVRMLADLMGPERFLDFLRDLLRRFRCRILSFDDFRSAAEETAGRDLGWFFHDWVDTNRVAGYAIENVRNRDGHVEVVVRRTGTARFPIEIRVTTNQGVQMVQRIAPDPDLQTLVFEAAGQPANVAIDPRGICPLSYSGRLRMSEGGVGADSAAGRTSR